MYLTTIAITPDPKLAELRDAEIEFVDKAKAEGVIHRLFVADDKTSAHIVFNAESEEEVRSQVTRFPYAPWFTIDSVVSVFEG